GKRPPRVAGTARRLCGSHFRGRRSPTAIQKRAQTLQSSTVFKSCHGYRLRRSGSGSNVDRLVASAQAVTDSNGAEYEDKKQGQQADPSKCHGKTNSLGLVGNFTIVTARWQFINLALIQSNGPAGSIFFENLGTQSGVRFLHLLNGINIDNPA